MPPPHLTGSNPAQSHRFHLLDGLRGLLALFVVYRHAPEFLAGALPSDNIFLAVDFFFCLSGFVIAFAYEDRLRGKLTVKDFLVARLIRFYPMFLIGTVLALLAALGPAHLLTMPGGRATLLAALPSLAFLPSIPLKPGFKLFPINMPSWTLLIELLANITFGLLLRRRINARAVFAIICIASWGELAFSHLRLDSGSTWPGLAIGLARMGYSFPMGVFLFYLWRKLAAVGVRRERGAVAAAVIVAVLLLAITLQCSFTSTRWYQLGVITFVMPALVFFGADVHLKGRWNRACSALGDLSYPLYIIHVPLLGPLFGTHVAHWTSGSRLLRRCIVPVYDLCLAALAWILEQYVDTPVRNRLSAAYRRHKRAAAPQGSTPQPLPSELQPAH